MQSSNAHFDFDYAPPPAAAMLESLRGMGYTLETAVADLIDNSIAAGARDVWIELYWNGRNSHVSILDDGRGMNEDTLRDAMRPGSQHPGQERQKTDLGRFGLGLKTASLSQCRSLTVASREAEKPTAVRRWDLDHVNDTNDWQLLKAPRSGAQHLLDALDPMTHGTLVLWEQLDRLVGDVDVDDRAAHRTFLSAVDSLKTHLAMVFHRYLEGGFDQLRIFINGTDDSHRIRPWDPFLPLEPATQRLPEEHLYTDSGEVIFEGFVLPHPDRLQFREQIEAAGGPDGWASQQGFYVYRNRRLLAWGTWLGLGDGRRWRKDELHKLARIRLDIPNSADSEWKIDIRKSTASPPLELRSRLTDLTRSIRDRAVAVFRHRGEYGPRSTRTGEHIRVWEARERKNSTVYRINRSHPMVQQQLEKAARAGVGVEPLLQVIEQSVPVQRIWVDVEAAGEFAVRTGREAPDELIDLAVLSIRQRMEVYGETFDQASERLLKMEPFSDYSDTLPGRIGTTATEESDE